MPKYIRDNNIVEAYEFMPQTLTTFIVKTKELGSKSWSLWSRNDEHIDGVKIQVGSGEQVIEYGTFIIVDNNGNIDLCSAENFPKLYTKIEEENAAVSEEAGSGGSVPSGSEGTANPGT